MLVLVIISPVTIVSKVPDTTSPGVLFAIVIRKHANLVERLLRRREVSDTVNASINSFVWKRLDGQCGFYCRNASGSLLSGIIFGHSVNNRHDEPIVVEVPV